MQFAMKIRLIFIFMVICYSKASVINQNVERTIDLTSHLVKVSTKILPKFENDSVHHYVFSLPTSDCNNLAFIKFQNMYKRELEYVFKNTSYGCDYWLIVNKSISSPVVYVEKVFYKLLTPHPKEILQSEKQFVIYYGNVYLFSKYTTVTQTTIVKLSSQNVLSYSEIKPVSISSNILTYGPYEHIEAMSMYPLNIHVENESPFLTVAYLERIIEVSHWGNIAIEEKIRLTHSGSRLKGQFSRYELQKDSRSGQSAIKSYKTYLPASAFGVYYRDGNGNISTSNMRMAIDSVELELRPRFTLFGGWKTDYILGYNVPSFEYLLNHKNNFLLKMRVIDHIYDEMFVEEAFIKIILPEGCRNIELITPYNVNRFDDNIYHTYLDTIGRPVISFSKYNLVENHIHDFKLQYTYYQIIMIQEPLLVVGFIYSLFLMVIIFTRLDFSISKKNHIHND